MCRRGCTQVAPKVFARFQLNAFKSLLRRKFLRAFNWTLSNRYSIFVMSSFGLNEWQLWIWTIVLSIKKKCLDVRQAWKKRRSPRIYTVKKFSPLLLTYLQFEIWGTAISQQESWNSRGLLQNLRWTHPTAVCISFILSCVLLYLSKSKSCSLSFFKQVLLFFFIFLVVPLCPKYSLFIFLKASLVALYLSCCFSLSFLLFFSIFLVVPLRPKKAVRSMVLFLGVNYWR